MKFYAANDLWGATATNTKIRNVRFKTENDGTDDWFVIDGSPCWDTCDQMGGKCDHCGANRFVAVLPSTVSMATAPLI